MVAATAFVIAGALRLTAASEQLGLSAWFAVFFFVVAAAQIAYGVLVSIGSPRATSAPAVFAASAISLGLVGLWLVATTATVPIYPLMNGALAVDVIDLSTALLEMIGVAALCKSLPQPARGRVTWTLVALVAAAWLVWVFVIVTNGLTD